MLSHLAVKLAASIALSLLLVRCAGATDGDRSSIAGTRAAAAHSRAELSFVPLALAPRAAGAATLVAGTGALAWVTLGAGEEPSASSDCAPAAPAPRAIAVDGEGRGYLLSSRGVDRVEGAVVSAVAIGDALAGMELSLAAIAQGDGALWLAGSELARVGAHDVDRAGVDGVSGIASALALSPDRATAWIAYGERLFSVRFATGAAPSIVEVLDLGIGEVRALAFDGEELLAGGSGGLALRDASGAWRRLGTGDVSAIAAGDRGGTWAVIDGALTARASDGFVRIELEGSGAGEIGALGIDALGAAIVARGSGLERYDLERRVHLRGLAPGAHVVEPVTVEVFADRAGELERIEATIAGRALTVEGDAVRLDPAALGDAAGDAQLEVRASYRDGTSAAASLAVVLAPQPVTMPPSFARDILPWAQAGCSCHFSGSSSIPSLAYADAWRQRSEIILRRVVDQQPPVMPPPEIRNRPTAEQRAILRRWLEGSRDD